ncbi:MAG: hypothetical protein IPL23_10935 [Saprospiraceae bacterium]|nr:hypothetical protein [Saprospiraceae bacterium]
MQKLIESAVSLGFAKSEAEMLSYQTFRGGVELFNNILYCLCNGLIKFS